MPPITTPARRTIIADFAREIQQSRIDTTKPSTDVINFRNDRTDGVERPIYRVPLNLLRYRKENGRIASDVLDYEMKNGPLDETDVDAQAKIRRFLEEKDPEKTATLGNSILHTGQTEAAIITCDGFLINGNRRKMVVESLHKAHPNREDFEYLKVVILPGNGEPGGPPTLIEIEKIENRYQLQSDGKSEYYGFDRALSIKRKIDIGLSLEDQLRDDPKYAAATPANFKNAIREWKNSYIRPLECIERYLKQFHREKQYRTISTGVTDREGRWQAFIDYSNTYHRVLRNPKRLIEYRIEEDEIGEIEEAAFSIIRLRDLPDLPKAHVIMRDLPKYCRTNEGKKHIKKIAKEVDPSLPEKDRFDSSGVPLEIEVVDQKWAAKFRQPIIHHTKSAAESHSTLKEKETPIGLLEAAHKKLIHPDMDLRAIAITEYKKAMRLTSKIAKEATDLEHQIYRFEKDLKKLPTKKP